MNDRVLFMEYEIFTFVQCVLCVRVRVRACVCACVCVCVYNTAGSIMQMGTEHSARAGLHSLLTSLHVCVRVCVCV